MNHRSALRHRSPFRFHIGFSVVCLLSGGLTGLACSVNSSGLGTGGQGGRSAGAGGAAGNRLTATGGGAVVPAASGGSPVAASGGAGGTTLGSGGVVGAGGGGTGGADTGSGGAIVASGGITGVGGAGEGGVSGGIAGATGTGGAVLPGTGGADGSCNAINCPDGCCNAAGRCVTGRTDARCGTAGVACAPCGSCFQCSNAGVCALTPSSSWEVICASARIAPTKPSGLEWDTSATGLPDSVCRSTLNGLRPVSTAYMPDTLSPMWGDSITDDSLTANALMSTMGRWVVSVIDEDTNGSEDDPICSLHPQLTEADFATGSVTLPPSGSCLSVTLELVCAE